MSWIQNLINPSSSATAAPAPSAAPAPAPGAAPATPPAAPSGSTSGAPGSTTIQDTQNSPLDNFSKLWNTPTGADGKPLADPTAILSAPLFTPDPVKVQEQAKTFDFTTGVDPEKVKAALGGDVAAFSEILNSAVQAGLVAATQVSTNMVNSGIVQNNQNFTKLLPTHIRTVQTAQMQSENPALSHPAVAPLVAAHKAQLLRSRPNATPEEITREVNVYFSAMAEAIKSGDPSQVAAKKAEKAQEPNWNDWANLDTTAR